MHRRYKVGINRAEGNQVRIETMVAVFVNAVMLGMLAGAATVGIALFVP